MKRRRALKLANHPLLALILWSALFARALCPDGFMPGPSGFVLCKGVGVYAASVRLTQKSGHAPADSSAHGVAFCPFAAATVAMAGAPALISPQAAPPLLHTPPPPAWSRIALTWRASSQLPRGPPEKA